MVGHIPLEDGILVRVQVPQPFDSLRSLMAMARVKIERGECPERRAGALSRRNYLIYNKYIHLKTTCNFARCFFMK